MTTDILAGNRKPMTPQRSETKRERAQAAADMVLGEERHAENIAHESRAARVDRLAREYGVDARYVHWALRRMGDGWA